MKDRAARKIAYRIVYHALKQVMVDDKFRSLIKDVNIAGCNQVRKELNIILDKCYNSSDYNSELVLNYTDKRPWICSKED